MGHFRRKCPMRKHYNRDAAEAKPLPAWDYCPTVCNTGCIARKDTYISCGNAPCANTTIGMRQRLCLCRHGIIAPQYVILGALLERIHISLAEMPHAQTLQ